MVGSRTQAAGAEAFRSSGELELIGLTEVLPALPRLWRLRARLVEEIRRRRPEAVVVVDSPDFHLPLVKSLRREGYDGPVIHIAPPTVWAWRRGRSKTLRDCHVLCLPLFDFENRLFLELGVRSRWKGHPLLETCRHWNSGVKENPLSGVPVVALLPGSRAGEIRELMPVLREVADDLAERGWCPVFSVAPGLSEEGRERLSALSGGHSLHEGPAAELLARCRVAVASSGTVTVEALLLDRFTVVGYRLSFLTWLVGRRLCPLAHYAMPNILAGEEIYPELIQSRWSSRAVLKALMAYEEDETYRLELHRKMARARERELGEEGAFDFWAETVLEALKR